MPLPPTVADRPEEGRQERDTAMQRVRVGVTGLAAVFLLTLLAAAILSLLGQDGRVRNRAAAALAGEAPREPLAELGVAPGATPRPAAKIALPSKPVARAAQRPATPVPAPAGSPPTH
jgi:hypothetical protein